VLLLGREQPTDARADKTPDFVAIRLLEVETGIEQCLVRGGDSKLGKPIGTTRFLGRRE
jgi:hypothetical protein